MQSTFLAPTVAELSLDAVEQEPSNSTEEPSKPTSKSKDVSDPESLDDEVIRTKIQEANQLIDRVKRALVRIKAIKSNDDNKENKSSSTDIEQQIIDLKKETKKLVTSNDQKKCLNLIDNPLKSKCAPICAKLADEAAIRNNTVRKNTLNRNDTINRTFIKESKEDNFTSGNIEGTMEIARGQCCDIYKFNLERPKTRRNEADDDLSEQLRKEKFRTNPDNNGPLETSSSLEELQAKLQTISETTESNYSTPRKKTPDALPNEENCKSSNTDPPLTECKEIQVEPEYITTATCCSFPKEQKFIQTIFNAPISKCIQAASLAVKRLSLQQENLTPREIVGERKKCTPCQIECLPILELVSPPERQICCKCEKDMELKEEHLQGVSIPSRWDKMKKLTVKMLPPIVIRQALVLTQVLNLSLTPEGRYENRVENTQNVAFIEYGPVENHFNIRDREDDDGGYSEKTSEGTEEKDLELEMLAEPLEMNPQDDKNDDMYKESNNDLASDDPDTHLVKIHDEIKVSDSNERVMPNNKIYKEKGPVPKKTASEEEKEKEERRQKMLWYRSYHIYDNPNMHDPGQLDQKSLEKVSQIDLQYYKTFINPDPSISDDFFTPVPSENRFRGFESKIIQCDESMIMAAAKIRATEEEMKNIVLSSSEELVKEANKVPDSQATVLNLKSGADVKSDKSRSSGVLKGKSEPSVKSNSSPSEITVTISYTLSTEDGSDKTTDKSISEIHETEIKTTNLDGANYTNGPDLIKNDDCQASKVLTVTDKHVLDQLHDKLKSVDPTASLPKVTMKKDSENRDFLDNFIKGLTSFNEEPNTNLQSSKENANNTVNYALNQDLKRSADSYAKHLEVGSNGRYKDEENLFTQLPHPILTQPYEGTYHSPRNFNNKERRSRRQQTFEHRDMELAADNNLLPMLPRHRLKRYSPDTSNSDTVTSNSISEGEILCRHSVSNGEIHVCHHSPQCPRMRGNISTRTTLGYPHQRLPPHRRDVPRKFDLNDPRVTIQQRRNYFNNWVTYYVRAQDVYESSTSSCSNNKN